MGEVFASLMIGASGKRNCLKVEESQRLLAAVEAIPPTVKTC